MPEQIAGIAEGAIALVRAISARAAGRGQRLLVGIAGAPGSGKSTLTEGIAARMKGRAEFLSMDGFHYDDAVLDRMGRRPWKGAPDTFDVDGLHTLLLRLRDPAQGAIAVPVFDRDLEISRGSARLIPPEAQIILVEGNYLLLDCPPWDRLAPLFDLTVMIEVPRDELRRRLTARWRGYDLPAAEIARRVEENDLPNGDLVMRGSRAADLVLRV